MTNSSAKNANEWGSSRGDAKSYETRSVLGIAVREEMSEFFLLGL